MGGPHFHPFGNNPPTRQKWASPENRNARVCIRIPARATPREQAWIQQQKTFRPYGLNVEVHATSKTSTKRQKRRNRSPSPPPLSYADAARSAAHPKPHQPPINYGRGKGKGSVKGTSQLPGKGKGGRKGHSAEVFTDENGWAHIPKKKNKAAKLPVPPQKPYFFDEDGEFHFSTAPGYDAASRKLLENLNSQDETFLENISPTGKN